MSNETLLPHLAQHNSWKRLFYERLQQFANWDEQHQILSSLFQSNLYKARQQLRSDTFLASNVTKVYEMITVTRSNLLQRLAEYESQLKAIRNNAPQEASSAIQLLRDRVRDLREQHNKQVRSIETSRRLLQSQRLALLTPVSGSLLKEQIDHAHQALVKSWNTPNMGRVVNNFFEDIDNNLLHIEQEIERVNGLLTSIYQRSEHSFSNNHILQSRLLNISKQRNQLKQLSKKSSDYRFSLTTLFTRKSVLINRFVKILVLDVREIYLNLNQYIDDGVKKALEPLVENNKQQKQMIEHHVQRLAELENATGDTHLESEKLQAHILSLQAALKSLEPLYQDIINAEQAATKGHPVSKTQRQVVPLMDVRQVAAAR